MLDVDAIFKNKKLLSDTLSGNGFCLSDGVYSKDIPIMDGQFVAAISISSDAKVTYKVFDAQSGEEYLLARVQDATGAFVGEVHKALAVALEDIARLHFETDIFTCAQTVRVLQYLKTKYFAQPEFLWKTFPEYAVFRISNGGSWFALMCRVCKRSFGLDDDSMVEVINLKHAPSVVSTLLEAHKAYPAYHMNKKCWYSVFLDDSLPDEELLSLIDASYALVSSAK